MKVSEIFYSLQGEGTQAGLPTVFLRLFACDLRCSWCDTMYAVEGRDFKNIDPEDVKAEILKYGCRRLCITGGEPLLQADDVVRLCEELGDIGFFIVLETSGHKKPPEIFNRKNFMISMDCKCPGSGMSGRMDFSLLEELGKKDQLKFVIKDHGDYEFAKNVLSSHKIRASVIFQPVSGVNLKWISESVLNDNMSNVRVLPQIHKLIWGNKRGF